jgi:hypothetical protein
MSLLSQMALGRAPGRRLRAAFVAQELGLRNPTAAIGDRLRPSPALMIEREALRAGQ